MNKLDKIINKCKEQTFKDLKIKTSYSETPINIKLNDNSKELLNNFTDLFITILNKKINLQKALDKKQSRETELIQDLETALLMSDSLGEKQTIEQCKELIQKYKQY